MQSISNQPAIQITAPPYRTLEAIEVGSPIPAEDGGGSILVWHLGTSGREEAEPMVVHRPAGMALAMILPDQDDRLSVLRVLRAIELCRPQSVMPYHLSPTAREITSVIRREPSCLASGVVGYLEWRGFPLDGITRSLLRRTVQLSSQVQTIAALSRNLYISRRGLGRKFVSSDLPVPSRWLNVSRILRATIRLQNSEASLFSVAIALGYADGFSLSNQMKRLCGIRPTEARERLGWEWVLERWLIREAAAGNITARTMTDRPSIASFDPQIARTERRVQAH